MKFAITVVEYDEFSNEVNRFNIYADALEINDNRQRIMRKNPFNPGEKVINYTELKIIMESKTFIRSENEKNKQS